MGKKALNFRFHNPNDTAETAQMLYRIFIEVGEKKLDNIIANMPLSEPTDAETHAEVRTNMLRSNFIVA